jgi:hypothetical protein
MNAMTKPSLEEPYAIIHYLCAHPSAATTILLAGTTGKISGRITE